MHTLITIALAGSFASANIPAQPQWQSDYREARQLALDGKKPLAVFIGKGISGWEKVAAEGNFDPKVNELLKDKYVCVYVNTDTAAGKKLAKDFDVAGKGLVISDKSGASQAFYHSGDLSKDLLEKALVRYADKTSVEGTETVANLAPPVTYSSAPLQYSTAPVQYGMARPYYGTIPSFGGGCANGNCGR